MPTLEPSEPRYNSEPPNGGGWRGVAVFAVTATAVTVTAIFTHSLDLAVLVGTLLRIR
jgi:hypothetical protein